MRTVRSQTRLLLIAIRLLVVVAVVLPACSKNPAGSGFPFEGKWIGTWRDGPDSAQFVMDVGAAGDATATGKKIAYTSGSLTVTETLSADDVFIDGDGRVTGTGIVNANLSGYGMYTIGGSMTGILYRSNNTGQGGLVIQIPGYGKVAFTWTVSKH